MKCFLMYPPEKSISKSDFFHQENKNIATMTSVVNDKMGSALVCQHRPLREGETPKVKGQTTVYEATGELNQQFREDLANGLLEASWKIDGTCCLIKHGKLYRRLDIREGKSTPPANAILGEADENGCVKICWLPLEDSTEPQDGNHLSALDSAGFWTLDMNDNMKPVVVPFDMEEVATYELIGPRLNGNPYLLEEIDTNVTLSTKKGLVPRAVARHYLVRHGDYKIPNFPVAELLTAENPVVFLRNLILTAKVEGIVFRHLTKPKVFYKVNQGHIGAPPKTKGKPTEAEYMLNPLI